MLDHAPNFPNLPLLRRLGADDTATINKLPTGAYRVPTSPRAAGRMIYVAGPDCATTRTGRSAARDAPRVRTMWRKIERRTR